MIKILLRIINLLFAPITIFCNCVIFSSLYFFIGSSSAFLYFERVSKRSVVPILRLFGASIGKNCSIETGLIFHNCTNYKNLKIGNNCHIGKKCFFDLRDCIVINDNVVISMQTTFITHQDFFLSSLSENFPPLKSGVIINKNSYIGAKSTILMGVVVEEKSIIGANSLVNKNVIKNTVVGGVPAKIIKKELI